MFAILFIICLFASAIGAVVGAGGGIIIKPVLDAIGLMPVSAVSFLSSCTVLCMALCSLIRTRNNGVVLELKTSTPLAIGAAFGGLLGGMIFDLVRKHFDDGAMLGCIQALILAALTSMVLIYIFKKDKLPSYHVEGLIAPLAIGAGLGLVSSFLGVGGGPYNVAVLFFFFTMEAKQAAKNSIYIIVFSQTVSIASTVISAAVPPVGIINLLCMAAGGAAGAMLGAEISKRISCRGVETALKFLCVGIICLNIFNALRFAFLL